VLQCGKAYGNLDCGTNAGNRVTSDRRRRDGVGIPNVRVFRANAARLPLQLCRLGADLPIGGLEPCGGRRRAPPSRPTHVIMSSPCSRTIVRSATKLLVPTFLAMTPAGAEAQDEILRGTLPPMPEVTYHPQPQGIEVQTFVSGLEVVWAMEFAPDGRLFVTERPGRVRTIAPDGTVSPEPWASLTVHHEGESGLMGWRCTRTSPPSRGSTSCTPRRSATAWRTG